MNVKTKKTVTVELNQGEAETLLAFIGENLEINFGNDGYGGVIENLKALLDYEVR